MTKLLIVATLGALGGATLLADFSYDQTTRITGGAMAGMMRAAGAFSKQAREPMTSTVLLKGDRMAHLSRDHVEIIDLNEGTITHVDLGRKTYSVMTFDQMKEQMQEMARRMEGKKNGEGADLNFKASIKETGQKKSVSGYDTHEVILTITMEGTDQKSGQSGAMNVNSDMWLTPEVSGYREVSDFQRRMIEKLGFMPGQGMAMGRPDMAKAMAQLAKESAKLKGVPVVSVVSIGGSGTGSSGQTASAPPPSSDSGDTMGRLGRLGGLGGFGRKKKAEQQDQAQDSGDAGTLIEMTMESSNFSSAAVDPSRLAIPAGFKQVEPEMMRRRGR